MPAVFVATELATGEFRVDWPALAAWAPLTGAVLGVGYLVYYTGLARGAVTVVSSAASAWLAITVLIAVTLFGETVAPSQLALMAAVLAGILLLSVGPLTGGDVGSGLPWGLGAMLGIGIAMALFDRVPRKPVPMLAVFGGAALSHPTYAFAARGVCPFNGRRDAADGFCWQ